jgi:hypothetical protein
MYALYLSYFVNTIMITNPGFLFLLLSRPIRLQIICVDILNDIFPSGFFSKHLYSSHIIPIVCSASPALLTLLDISSEGN